MHISNLKLWNFRKFGNKNREFNFIKPDLNLNFNKHLNVLIGENDSGKTAIIDAIKLVLKTHSYEFIKIDEDDFHEDSQKFRIELKFEGFSDDEAKNFTEWLSWNKETKEPYLKLILDCRRKDGKILPTDVRAGSDEDGSMLNAEAREYLKVTYLKPLRDAESELISKRNSRLSQVLHAHDSFKNKKDEKHKFIRASEIFNKFLEKYFEKPEGGKRIKDSIDLFIGNFFDSGNTAKFKTGKTDIRSILEKLEIILNGEDNPGLGTLNRLFMATELLHLTKDNWSGARIALIEELEAHLHPQAQMKVIEALQKQKESQLFLTTHSPNLTSKVELKHLIWCNSNNAFSMGSENPKESNPTKLEPENYVYLEKFLDVTKSNLFFAKGVIIVEGCSEEILIPSIAKAIGINLTQKEVSIANVGGKTYKNFAKIFLRSNQDEKMNIPVAVVTDSDVREYEKDGSKKDNYKELYRTEAIKICKEIDKDNVKGFVASQWTLEYCLFKSKTPIPKVFQSVAKKIHSGTNWDDFEKELAKKLQPGGTLEKTEIAYKMAKQIDRILPKITIKKQKLLLESLSNDDSIKYLVDAIKYASGE